MLWYCQVNLAIPVEMDILIQPTAKTLDERYRTRPARVSGQFGLVNQMGHVSREPKK